EAKVAAALRLLTTPGEERCLLFVTGDSGCGKSSFVQAGLLPALDEHYRARGLAPRWPAAVLRSGRFPLAALEDGLAQIVVSEPTLTDDNRVARHTGAQLKSWLRTSTPPGQVNVLILDQFEEHFTSQADPTQRAVVFDFLKGLGSFAEVRTHIVIALRADF